MYRASFGLDLKVGELRDFLKMYRSFFYVDTLLYYFVYLVWQISKRSTKIE